MKTTFLAPATLLVLALAFAALPACRSGQDKDNMHQVEEKLTASDPLLELLDSTRTGIGFVNRIQETYENNITTNINMYNGGGLAVADINNDGLPDLYFLGSNGPNKLYLNEGKLKFRDITQSSGLASEEGFETAVTAVDINADGLLDFYVCRGGVEKNEARRNKLYVNNGDLTFTERSKEYGLDDGSASTGANFFDYDGDGDLDVYIINYPTESIWTNKIESRLGDNGKYQPMLYPRAEFDSDRFYRNDGGKFTDVSKEAGIWNLSYGLSVSVTDFNRDGRPDIYVGNDFIQPDYLYINNGDGTFTDRLGEYFRHTSQHTMGTDLTDFDNDGWVDLYAVDMLSTYNSRQKSFFATNTQSKYSSLVQNGYFEPVIRNVLQRNNGNGTFSDIGCLASVYKTDWSWSGLLFDIDNNGLRDLHVTNGYRREVTDRDFIDFTLPEKTKEAGSGKRLRDIYPDFRDFLDIIPTYKLRNFVFENNGNWQFNDLTGKWMTMPSSWSCGSVWSDLDLDGDLELVVSNLDDPAFVYENKARDKKQADANYLQVELRGAPANPFAVGASVSIWYGDGQKQYSENYPTRGIFSSVEHLQHFGLGNVSKVDRVLVRWPDGKTQEFRDVAANQRLKPQYAQATGTAKHIAPVEESASLMDNISRQFSYRHVENDFNDFEQYPLNPWKMTELGPTMATGDVNGDGLGDLFIGNGFDQPAALYLQKPDGSFSAASTKTWQDASAYEDHGAIFLDADGDRDLDLLVISGGMEAQPEVSAMAWQNRLYLNDGKGNFTLAEGAVPQLGDVFLRAAAHDYDGDGDPDLFLGGRVTPTQWPLTPASAVLRNDKGKFTDVSEQVAGDFRRCGMVTDLEWVNVDKDPQPELVVVGEWMPVSIFKLQNGKLVDKTSSFGLDESNGFWFSLATADLDGDGDQDLVTGNLGLNTRFSTADGPLRCFAKDFDKNGTLDPIMAFSERGKLHPLVQKDVLNKHMPVLKKKFLYAKVYAEAEMKDVWPQDVLDQALNLSMHTLETSWWENRNGQFVRHGLPVQAQLGPVQGIAVTDVNGDGNADLVMAGNKFGMEVETNQCNASNGSVLLGDGKGGFRWLNNTSSGFWAMKEGRDLLLVKGKGTLRTLFIANNNGPMDVYRLK